MLTDRDIVVRGLATGKRPDQAIAGDLNQGEAVTIGADDSVEEVMTVMIDHRVKRLPVIDGQQLVGVVTVADVARGLPNPRRGAARRSALPRLTKPRLDERNAMRRAAVGLVGACGGGGS